MRKRFIFMNFTAPLRSWLRWEPEKVQDLILNNRRIPFYLSVFVSASKKQFRIEIHFLFFWIIRYCFRFSTIILNDESFSGMPNAHSSHISVRKAIHLIQFDPSAIDFIVPFAHVHRPMCSPVTCAMWWNHVSCDNVLAVILPAQNSHYISCSCVLSRNFHRPLYVLRPCAHAYCICTKISLDNQRTHNRNSFRPSSSQKRETKRQFVAMAFEWVLYSIHLHVSSCVDSNGLDLGTVWSMMNIWNYEHHRAREDDSYSCPNIVCHKCDRQRVWRRSANKYKSLMEWISFLSSSTALAETIELIELPRKRA